MHTLARRLDDVREHSLARAACLAANELKHMVRLPARAVLDTRPDVESGWSGTLRQMGLRLIHAPTIAIEGAPGLDAARHTLGSYDWVVITSKRGVEALLGGGPVVAPSSVRWAAVGESTAAALRERGVQADVIPDNANSDAIPSAMAAHGPLRGSRVLLARADIAGDSLPEGLRLEGAEVDDVVAYRTVTAPKRSRQAVLEALADSDLEAIIFASGSAVRGLVELAEAEVGRARGLKVFTIGPKTSAVARELGFTVTAEAATPSTAGLLSALRERFDEEVERWVESQLPQRA